MTATRDVTKEPTKVPVIRVVLAIATLGAGAGATWASLTLPPGDSRFVPYALILASIWAFGSVLVGLRGIFGLGEREGLLRAIGVGAALCAASVAGGAVVRFVPWLGDLVKEVLSHSASGSLATIAVVTALAGIAEELFFRGALYSLVPVRPVVLTTVLYALVTAASGNLMLVGAALLVGSVTAYQRYLTGGVVISLATHVVWAMTMLFALPPLLG